MAQTIFDKPVGTEIQQLNNNLGKHTIGTAVNIISYNSLSNPYTCPSDGYVTVVALYTTTPFVSVHFVQNNAELQCGVQVQNRYDMASVFVRKGMKVYINSTGSGGTYPNTAQFFPLE